MSNFLTRLKNFFYDVQDVSIVLLSTIATIFAGLFFIEKKKNQVQKELTQNATTIQKVDNIDTQIANDTLQEKEKEDAPVTQADLLGFLDNINKPK